MLNLHYPTMRNKMFLLVNILKFAPPHFYLCKKDFTIISHIIVRYIKYMTNIFGLVKMSSDVVYSDLLYKFVIFSVNNYKKSVLPHLVQYNEFSV